jgi:hypothetical protein
MSWVWSPATEKKIKIQINKIKPQPVLAWVPGWFFNHLWKNRSPADF